MSSGADRRPSRVAALVSIAAILIAALGVAFSLPIDDFWLSIASGRAILHGADPRAAIPFSWMPTLPGALNPQWGAQVLLAAVDNLGWALFVNAALIAIGLGLTVERMRGRGRPEAVAVASLLALTVLSVHLLARPQSFSIALLPAALLLLERFAARWWLPMAFGVLVAVWANLHGAFVLAQLAALTAVLGAGYDRWRRRGGTRDRCVAVSTATLIAAAVAPLLNPVGPALLGYAYGQGTSDVVRAISVEWQPAWPWEPVGALFWIFAILLVLGRLVRGGSVWSGELLLSLVLGGLAASGIRFIPFFVLGTAPLLVSDVERFLATRPVVRRALGEVPAVLRGRASVGVGAIAAVCLALQPIRPILPASIARLTPDEPATSAARLEALAPGSRARILNEQVWGGFLVWDLGDRVSTAMDGRIEIRSRETWQRYFDLMAGRGDPVAELARSHVDWALLFPDRKMLMDKLLAEGWTVTLRSDEGVLLHRS